MNLRPYTTYKAFGGVITVFTLLYLIFAALNYFKGVEPISIPMTIVSFILSVLGIFIFIWSGRKIDQIKNQEREKQKNEENPPQGKKSIFQMIPSTMDIKAMLIFAAALILFFIFLVLSDYFR